MAQVAIPVEQVKDKAYTLGTSAVYGAMIGGLARVSPVASAAALYLGALGGLAGSFITPAPYSDLFEGIAGTSLGIFAAGVTAPATVTPYVRAAEHAIKQTRKLALPPALIRGGTKTKEITKEEETKQLPTTEVTSYELPEHYL